MYNSDDAKDPIELLIELKFVVSNLVDHANNLLGAYDSCRDELDNACDREEKEIMRMGRDYNIILRRLEILEVEGLGSDVDEAIFAFVQMRDMVNLYIQSNPDDAGCREKMLVSLEGCMR
jgi:hypothetical protein